MQQTALFEGCPTTFMVILNSSIKEACGQRFLIREKLSSRPLSPIKNQLKLNVCVCIVCGE